VLFHMERVLRNLQLLSRLGGFRSRRCRRRRWWFYGGLSSKVGQPNHSGQPYGPSYFRVAKERWACCGRGWRSGVVFWWGINSNTHLGLCGLPELFFEPLLLCFSGGSSGSPRGNFFGVLLLNRRSLGAPRLLWGLWLRSCRHLVLLRHLHMR